MKIRSIELCNYKNFKGKNKIDFSLESPNRNNIALIGGLNGSGKTTLVESIRLCLFGKRFNGTPPTKEKYYKLLESAKNRSSVKEKDENYYIKLMIEIDDTFPNYSITVKRVWNLKHSKIIDENFYIFRDNSPLEIIPRDYWEEYILSLIPQYISDYFFFDGERVKELASGNKADQILKDSIKELIGLKLYETLNSDLDVLKQKIIRRNIRKEKVNKELSDNEIKLGKIHKEMSDTKKAQKKVSKELNTLYDRRNQLEKDLKRKAGAFAKEKDNCNNKLFQFKTELDDLNTKIREICGEVLPFVIASDLCENLLKQLKSEKRIKELIASKNVLEEAQQKFDEKFSNSNKMHKLKAEQIDYVKQEVKDIFSELIKDIPTESSDFFIHDLSNAEINNIEYFFSQTEKGAEKELNDLLKKRERNILETKKLREELSQVPDETFVSQFLDEISSINTKIGTLQKEIQNSEIRLNSLKDEENKILESIRKLEEKIVCIDEDNKKIQVTNNLKKSLEEFSHIIIKSQIHNLEDIITEMYRKLANKDDMVKEIRIDTETFDTKLLDYEGGIIDKGSISEGEKEIYALSVLWGLSKISNRKLPLIIDSPLAKLDKNHVDKITQNFFPNAAEQVIILVHDREIDKALYKKISPYLTDTLSLSFDESNKITKGYYFN